MKKIIKKYKILIAIVLIFLAIIGISILFFIKSHEKKIFKAYMSDSTIIKYISKDNVIKTELKGTESIVYHNNKKVALLKNEEKDNTYIESYYLLKNKKEIYQGKSIYYKESNGDIKYQEYYNHNDEKIKTYHYKNNKIVKIIFHTDLDSIDYEYDNSKLVYKHYKKGLLFEKCYFDKTNTYQTYCEQYDRNNKIILKREYQLTEYGNRKKTMVHEDNSKSTGIFTADNQYLHVTLNNDLKGMYEIQKIYLFGSKYLYNSPYIFNTIKYSIKKVNDNESFYDEYEQLRSEAHGSDEGKMFISLYHTVDSELNKETVEYITYQLCDKVKFKNFSDLIDYTYSSHIDNNAKYYVKYNDIYMDGYKIKTVITKLIDFTTNKYFEGEYVSDYYDWFTGEEVEEEEFNTIMEEYNRSNE